MTYLHILVLENQRKAVQSGGIVLSSIRRRNWYTYLQRNEVRIFIFPHAHAHPPPSFVVRHNHAPLSPQPNGNTTIVTLLLV
jgi:hypothetical protein